MEEPPNIAETLQRLIEEEIINTEDDDSDFFFLREMTRANGTSRNFS